MHKYPIYLTLLCAMLLLGPGILNAQSNQGPSPTPSSIVAPAIPNSRGIEALIINALKEQNHWSILGRLTPSITTVQQAQISGFQANGIVRASWPRLPGGAQIAEDFAFSLKSQQGGPWTLSGSDLVSQGSKVSELTAPPKKDTLLLVYQQLRNKESVGSILQLAKYVVAFYLIDAYTTSGGPVQSQAVVIDASNPARIRYHWEIKIPLSLDFEYLAPRNPEASSFELFRREGIFLLTLQKTDAGPWSIKPQELEPLGQGFAERSISTAPLPGQSLGVFYTLERDGFDRVWGQQAQYKAGLAMAGQIQ